MGTPVQVRLQPDDLAALDAYRTADEPMTRPQAIRAALADWLRTHGFAASGGGAPIGPATEAVKAMEVAIAEHRRSNKQKA